MLDITLKGPTKRFPIEPKYDILERVMQLTTQKGELNFDTTLDVINDTRIKYALGLTIDKLLPALKETAPLLHLLLHPNQILVRVGLIQLYQDLLELYRQDFSYNSELTIKSIDKWYRVAFEGVTEAGVKDCPLCQVYFEKGCEGCPISNTLDTKCCAGTPYVRWTHTSFNLRVHTEESFFAALDEIYFLHRVLLTTFISGV